MTAVPCCVTVAHMSTVRWHATVCVANVSGVAMPTLGCEMMLSLRGAVSVTDVALQAGMAWHGPALVSSSTATNH